MQILREYALSLIGTPYKYGGNNPVEGMDCSGLVCELLRSSGLVQGDMSAQALHDYFESQGCIRNSYSFGALAFFGKSVKDISHVAFILDRFRMLEAGGGDSLTLTREDAARKNAFVKVSMISHRKDRVAILKPNYATIGVV